jgi:prepilin-type N-terminal cleavage/methylation domain-containing protein
MKLRNARRPSFTLIEILIVIAIIAVLIAIAVGAYYRTAQVAQRKATESFLSTLDSAYKKAEDKILRDCRVSAIPANIQAMAINQGEDQTTQQNRAMVLYQKFTMRQEFPMSFYEALNPSPLGPKRTYVDKLAKAGVTAATVAATDTVGPWESAICLEMALEESRGGITQITSTLGAGASVDCPYIDPNHPNWNLKALKALVDPYGQPVFYYRWAGNFMDYQVANIQSRNDPGDPEGLLSDPGWVSSSNGQNFIAICHWVGPGQSLNQSHLFVSAGLDGYLGMAPGAPNDQSDLLGGPAVAIQAGAPNSAGVVNVTYSTGITGQQYAYPKPEGVNDAATWGPPFKDTNNFNVYSNRLGAPGN